MAFTSVSQEPKRFCRIQLDILPPRSELVVDCELRIATLLQERRLGDKTIVEQQRLAQQELDLFFVLCQNYPEYAPYAHLVASMTGQVLEASQQKVLRSLQEGGLEEQVHHMRYVLSALRQKVRHFGIMIAPLLQMGYILQPEQAPARYKREVER
jgi:hypothetical protein